MANLRITWKVPLTRANGKPLKPEDVARYFVQLSADGGQNYASLVDVIAPNTETLAADLEPGTWFGRVKCVDKFNLESGWATGSVVIPENSPPGTVLDLTLELAQ